MVAIIQLTQSDEEKASKGPALNIQAETCPFCSDDRAGQVSSALELPALRCCIE